MRNVLLSNKNTQPISLHAALYFHATGNLFTIYDPLNIPFCPLSRSKAKCLKVLANGTHHSTSPSYTLLSECIINILSDVNRSTQSPNEALKRNNLTITISNFIHDWSLSFPVIFYHVRCCKFFRLSGLPPYKVIQSELSSFKKTTLRFI